jgi:exosortase A
MNDKLLGLGAVCGIAAIVIFSATVSSMVSSWTATETYTHGFLVLPSFLYMAWNRRKRLALLPSTPSLLGFVLVAVATLCWMFGRIAGVQLVQQLALVAVLQALVWAIFGARVARELLGPLALLFFAVPVGEGLVPALQDFTAFFAVRSLQLSGVPVLQQGRFITTTAGSWVVAEACSGVSYVIPAAMLGVVFCFFSYKRWSRHTTFMIAALAAPILVNGLRVYIIIMLAQLAERFPSLSGVSNAVHQFWGHRLYGTIIFAVMMFVLFKVGSRWAELPSRLAPAGPAPEPLHQTGFASSRPVIVTAAAIVLFLSARIGADVVFGPVRAASVTPTAPSVTLPWRPVPGRLQRELPRFSGADLEIVQTYAAGENRAQVYIAYYGHQEEGSELISSENRLADEAVWSPASVTQRRAVIDGKETGVTETILQALNDDRRVVWSWYWVGGEITTNPYWAKVLQARNRLLRRSDAGAGFVVVGTSADALEDFVAHAQLLSSLERR